jgi:hypothetical protein
VFVLSVLSVWVFEPAHICEEIAMKNVIVSMVALAGLATGAMAQLNETVGGRLSFQVWNGSSWASTTDALPGSTVQVRAVVSYTGTNTAVSALGSITYQPTFSNADNTGTGAQIDQLGAYRNSGTQGNAVAGSMLTAADGQSGAALPSYGRVVYGSTAANATSQNIVTTFRHGGGAAQAGAPAGSWIRVAGSFVSTWPLAALPAGGDATATNLNNINRGVQANQTSATNAITNLPNTFHVAGTQNLVIFRQAITLSDLTDLRQLVISTAAGTLQRVGGVNAADDTRFMSWQTAATDNGSWRVGVAVENASINVVPTPATAALLGLGGLVAARRRRA